MQETVLLAAEQHEVAQQLASLLNSRQIPARVVKHEQQYLLLLKDASQVEQAKELAEAFRENPDLSSLAGDGWKRQTGVLKGMRQRSGKLTWAVVVVCMAFFAVFWLTQSLAFYRLFLFAPEPMQSLELWRWVSPIFLHFSLSHLLMNLVLWWELARLIEKQNGTFHLLLLTGLIAVFSNFAQFVVGGANFGGLSGVVYGLLAYLWVYGLLNPKAGYRIRPGIVIFMLVWMAVGFAGVFDNVLGKMANLAHLMGFVSGLAAGIGFALFDRRS